MDVKDLTGGLTSVTTGFAHTCALTVAGGVKCWGAGQLGDGATTFSPVPVDVTGPEEGVDSVTAGSGHTCVLTSSAGIKCWGYNMFGKGETQKSPKDVMGFTNGVAAVSAGVDHICVLMIVGSVKCRGLNDRGQLGDGTTAARYSWVDVTGLPRGTIAVSAGESHSCALTRAGGVRCWGNNGHGRLGDGTTTDSITPVDVLGFGSNAAR